MCDVEDLLAQLCETDGCFYKAKKQLHEQQAIISGNDHLPEHEAVTRLLSNGLRTFAWLEDQRNGLIEGVGEYLPFTKR